MITRRWSAWRVPKMYVYVNPYEKPYRDAKNELEQLNMSLAATRQRLEAIETRIRHLNATVKTLEPLVASGELSPERFGNLSALCSAVLSANSGLPMTVPQISQVIEKMGIRLEYKNAASALHTTLRRLGARPNSGVETLLPGMAWQGTILPPGPPRFYWDPAYPPPSPEVPFPNVMF